MKTLLLFALLICSCCPQLYMSKVKVISKEPIDNLTYYGCVSVDSIYTVKKPSILIESSDTIIIDKKYLYFLSEDSTRSVNDTLSIRKKGNDIKIMP